MKKRCGNCGETKPVKQFYKRKLSQDGYQIWCKACINTYKKSEKGKEVGKRYDRSEKRKQSNDKYQQSDKAKKTRQKYRESPEYKEAQKRHNQSPKGQESKKRYNKSEKGKQQTRKDKAIRKTRDTEAGGSYSQTEWYNLCKFYDFRCLKCNKQFPFEKLTVDHIRPISKGGSSNIYNLQPLCNRCNNIKHNREIDYRKKLPDWINRDGPIWQQDRLF